jgi:multimeric flavodoxin WrbA
MKVIVITSSPRKKGTTALLADEFIRGAKEVGHDVCRFDAAFEKVAPCIACDACRTGGGKCVQKDSMEKLNPELLAADVVAFVTPLYYFGMSAQLKTVIDRFYANNSKLQGSGKTAILLAAAHDTQDWTMQALENHYKTILKYLKWSDGGIILAAGCGSRSDIEKTDYSGMAYQLGKKL